MKKALFIGGTGTISSAITRRLSWMEDWELWLLNRGNRNDRLPENVKTLTADIRDEKAVNEVLKDLRFDVVADFIVMLPEEIERDIRLFSGRTAQYIFISSASAYQKPLSLLPITESTPLANPFWQYSRDKIACEEALTEEYRKNGFPMTIVRPSHTYSDRYLPLVLGGGWQIIQRMRAGKPIIIPGDGTTLWTLTHNTDFAKAFVGLMGNAHSVGESVHITSDESLTWNRIYQTVGEALGVEVDLRHIASDFLIACDPGLEGPLLGDKSVTVMFDNTKIKRLVPGFNATVRFDEGVRGILDAIFADSSLQFPDEEFDLWCDRVIAANEAGLAAFRNPSA